VRLTLRCELLLVIVLVVFPDVAIDRRKLRQHLIECRVSERPVHNCVGNTLEVERRDASP
jgi:hypothetical protein